MSESCDNEELLTCLLPASVNSLKDVDLCEYANQAKKIVLDKLICFAEKGQKPSQIDNLHFDNPGYVQALRSILRTLDDVCDRANRSPYAVVTTHDTCPRRLCDYLCE